MRPELEALSCSALPSHPHFRLYSRFITLAGRAMASKTKEARGVHSAGHSGPQTLLYVRVTEEIFKTQRQLLKLQMQEETWRAFCEVL